MQPVESHVGRVAGAGLGVVAYQTSSIEDDVDFDGIGEVCDNCPGVPNAAQTDLDGDGLQDRGITRDLDWGIPVKKGEEDWPGMEGKVFYVWFDAPIEYIAATAEWADAHGHPDRAWERWWRTDKGAADVRYTQFMGKDNVPFHTLSFPVTILGSGEPWKLVDYIKSFNYLNYDGGQFSTSQGSAERFRAQCSMSWISVRGA